MRSERTRLLEMIVAQLATYLQSWLWQALVQVNNWDMDTGHIPQQQRGENNGCHRQRR